MAGRRGRVKCDLVGTALADDELGAAEDLLEQGCAVLLVPMGDQVVVAAVDLDTVSRAMGAS